MSESPRKADAALDNKHGGIDNASFQKNSRRIAFVKIYFFLLLIRDAIFSTAL